MISPFRRRLAALMLTSLAGSSAGSAAAPTATNSAAGRIVVQHLSHGRFQGFPVFSPVSAPTSVVLLLSGAVHWDVTITALAQQFAEHGALVIGIDQPKLRATLQQDPSDCVLPDGDLENLSHFVQAYLHLSTYFTPLLVGEGTGGALAYALSAQAPRNTFGGALSLGFCPELDLDKPLCDKNTALRLGTRHRGRFELLPSMPPAAWTVIADSRGAPCPLEATRRFVSATPGATLMTSSTTSSPKSGGAPSHDHGHRDPRAVWGPEVERSFNQLVAGLQRTDVPLAPAALGDLPVVEVAAAGAAAARHGDVFVIMMSGDGGWAGIDQGVAAAFSAAGVPVVGLDSLRYYWTARTPTGLAADTDRLIRYYRTHFGRPRVLLVGYSQGADTLPFAVNRLPTATRAKVALVALLGVSAHALFEFHLTSWVADDQSGPETVPEIRQMPPTPVLCVYGAEEADSPCPGLDRARIAVVELKGGHHFDGDYGALAARILAAVPPATPMP
jgi:type IV secretory pathway VirJ component